MIDDAPLVTHLNFMRMTETRTLREIAHETRSILSVIRLTVETLMAQEGADETRVEFEAILKQVDRLAEIADEIARAKT